MTIKNEKGSSYPVLGDESIMSAKQHGTSATPVQDNLRYQCDRKLADRICNFNRHYAEHAGYFVKHLKEMPAADKKGPVTFFDSNSGLPLFQAPINRSWKEFFNESKRHGWYVVLLSVFMHSLLTYTTMNLWHLSGRVFAMTKWFGKMCVASKMVKP